MVKSPDAFRTIGEVAEWLDTPTHVIRFWESRFDEIDPVQKDGGRRYFRPNDLQIMGGLKKLLHEDGLTIKAVQNMIAEQGIEAIKALSIPLHEEQVESDAGTEDGSENASEPLILTDLAEAEEPAPAQEPVQKPMLLVPAGEILEPSHKWHLKTDSLSSSESETAMARLTELRDRLNGLKARSADLLEKIQD